MLHTAWSSSCSSSPPAALPPPLLLLLTLARGLAARVPPFVRLFLCSYEPACNFAYSYRADVRATPDLDWFRCSPPRPSLPLSPTPYRILHLSKYIRNGVAFLVSRASFSHCRLPSPLTPLVLPLAFHRPQPLFIVHLSYSRPPLLHPACFPRQPDGGTMPRTEAVPRKALFAARAREPSIQWFILK